MKTCNAEDVHKSSDFPLLGEFKRGAAPLFNILPFSFEGWGDKGGAVGEWTHQLAVSIRFSL